MILAEDQALLREGLARLFADLGHEVVHPAYRGARWALDFLNRKLDTFPGELADAPRRV